MVDPITPAPQQDPTQAKVVLLVIAFLGGLAVMGIGFAGLVVLQDGKDAVPGELWGLIGTLVGSLGTLLVTTRTSTTPGGTPPP